jgi:hypothetical protein
MADTAEAEYGLGRKEHFQSRPRLRPGTQTQTGARTAHRAGPPAQNYERAVGWHYREYNAHAKAGP